MTAYEQAQETLRAEPRTWLITGVAGFIGSHLLARLLELNQRVVGLDDFSTGKHKNLEEVKRSLATEAWERFTFLAGDIVDPASCQQACKGVDYVLHQAALGSVGFSIENPLCTNAVNVTGFLNMLLAARDQRVKRFIYASSSSIYGDLPELPKTEAKAGEPISPYAVTKAVNELYARAFAINYGMETIGLRYFNIFGERQDPQGAYAAVIPQWISAMIKNRPAYINGDGSTSRDFCYVANAVQANLLAATTKEPQALNRVFNVAVGARTSLNELFILLREKLASSHAHLAGYQPEYRPFRSGDVLHSQADISLARKLLGYEPSHTVEQGLAKALDWYRSECG